MKKRDAVFFPSRLDYYFVSSHKTKETTQKAHKKKMKELSSLAFGETFSRNNRTYYGAKNREKSVSERVL